MTTTTAHQQRNWNSSTRNKPRDDLKAQSEQIVTVLEVNVWGRTLHRLWRYEQSWPSLLNDNKSQLRHLSNLHTW